MEELTPEEARKFLEEQERRNEGMQTKCPTCGSDDTNTIRILFQADTYSGQMGGVGIGVGTGGVGIGAGAAGIGLSSNLAAKYRLGPNPVGARASARQGAVITGVCIVIMVAVWAAISPTAPWATLVIVPLWIMGQMRPHTGERFARRLAAHKKLIELHQRGWVCMRCGADWIPS